MSKLLPVIERQHNSICVNEVIVHFVRYGSHIARVAWRTAKQRRRNTMAESEQQSFRDLLAFIGAALAPNADVDAAELEQRLQDAQPSFLNLLQHKANRTRACVHPVSERAFASQRRDKEHFLAGPTCLPAQ